MWPLNMDASGMIVTLFKLSAAGEAGAGSPAAQAVPEPAGDGVGVQQGALHAIPDLSDVKSVCGLQRSLCLLSLDAGHIKDDDRSSASLVEEDVLLRKAKASLAARQAFRAPACYRKVLLLTRGKMLTHQQQSLCDGACSTA